MCKKKAIATTLQEAIDYYYKVEVIYMLSGGVGARSAPDFDGPDAGLGCDGAVNNKDSPSLFSFFPPSSSPFPLFPESTNLQEARRWRPEAEGRRPTKMGGWEGGCVRGVAPRKFWNTGPGR